MNAIKALIITLLLCCGLPVEAVSFSSTNNGIYIAVAAWRNGSGFVTNKTIRFDDTLGWHPFSEVGKLTINYPGSAYLMKINMTNADGKEVQKTSLGKLFGMKFEKVKRFEDTDGRVSGGFVVDSGYGGEFTDAVFFLRMSCLRLTSPVFTKWPWKCRCFRLYMEAPILPAIFFDFHRLR
jgi:hypothetical protein